MQRYAREITRGIDAMLGEANARARVLTPVGTEVEPDLQALSVTPCGPWKGYAWEQIVLPARCAVPLLNLCNTAPAVKRRQVVCIHDGNVFTRPESYSRLFRTTYRALLPWLARRAARVATVSRFSATQLAAYLSVAAQDVVVLPNGHEHVFRWDATASRLAGRFDDHRPFVLLLGSRAAHKNAALILRQAESLDALGLDLVVVGGEAGIFATAPAFARANVIQLGAVSDDDLALLLRRALCLAFPSLTEGFGLPIVEAMALGCPVVSSDRASMPEVCGSAALLASPEDGAAWRTHFVSLMGSAALREDLRGRGKEQVRQFSWAASARGYLTLLGDAA